jgi:hypothetical protein
LPNSDTELCRERQKLDTIGYEHTRILNKQNSGIDPRMRRRIFPDACLTLRVTGLPHPCFRAVPFAEIS